jgi:hypothetical protein
VYRGFDQPNVAWDYNQTCLDTGLSGSSTTDTLFPTAGELFFYLVSRKDPACLESSLGQDSAGGERPNFSPCQ